MASPESLCAVFGRRLPKELADIIFEYGFHLWLATPHNRWAYRDMGRYQRSESNTICGVKKSDLSERARELVEFDDYWEWKVLRGEASYGWTLRVSPQGTFCKCGSAENPRSCDQCQVFRPR
jgi:hypothetical protein